MRKIEEVNGILADQFIEAEPRWNRHLEFGGITVSGFEVRRTYSTEIGGALPGAQVWFRPSKRMAEDSHGDRIRDQYLSTYAEVLASHGFKVGKTQTHLIVDES